MPRYLITGASRGIGRAIAEKLAAPGIELLLHGRDQEALVEVYTEIEQHGAQGEIMVCDLADAAAIEKMLHKIGDTPLDALINNAGISVVKPFDQLSLEEWRLTLAVNVTAPFVLTSRLAKHIPAGGAIVNVMSVAAHTAFPGWSSYCMSKFALEGFSRSVREELRAKKVRVINVYPSATDTEIWDDVPGDWPREKMLSPEEVAEAVAYALSRPAAVAVENISVGNVGGAL